MLYIFAKIMIVADRLYSLPYLPLVLQTDSPAYSLFCYNSMIH